MLEARTKRDLMLLSTAWCAAMGCALSTASQRAARDPQLFQRIKDGHDSSFTVRKYDTAVAWFDENWPEGLAWPVSVERPSASSAPRVKAKQSRRRAA